MCTLKRKNNNFSDIFKTILEATQLPPKPVINKKDKQEKEEIVPKNFDTFYSAVKARWETSINKHLIDSNVNSPRIKLIQSDIIILDNRDTK